MRKVLLLLVFFVSVSEGTVHRYFSKSLGSDASVTGSQVAPWSSTAKYNTFTFTAETTYVHFRSGDVWDTIPTWRMNGVWPVIHSWYDGTAGVSPLPRFDAGRDFNVIPVKNNSDTTLWTRYRGDTVWSCSYTLGQQRLWADTGTGLWEMPFSVGSPGGGNSPDSISSVRGVFDTSGWQLSRNGWAGRYDGWYNANPNAANATTILYVYSPHINPAIFYDSIGVNRASWNSTRVPLNVSGLSLVTFEYIEFVGGSQNANLSSASNIEIRYCSFLRANMQAIYLNSANSTYIHHNFIDRQDTIQYSRNQSGGSGSSWQIGGGGGNNNRFEDNYCKDSKYEGWLIQVGTGNQVLRNTFVGKGGDYSHLFGCEVGATNNYAARNKYFKMRCRAQIYGNRNTWEYEIVDTLLFPTARIDAEDVAMGVWIMGGDSNTIRGWTVNNTYGISFGFQTGAVGNTIERCIVVNSARYAGSLTPPHAGTWANPDGFNARNVFLLASTTAEVTNNTFRRNILYNDTLVSSRVIKVGGPYDSGTLYTLSSVLAVNANWTNNQFTDPKFVSWSGGNFKLAEDSPARDAGGSTPVPSSSVDYYGVAVPYNALYDIGAAEYDSTPPVDPPGPTGLKRILLKAH